MPEKSILLVDDDILVLRSIGPFLSAQGYTVTEVSNPGMALGILEKERFDLVITDLVMGAVDGIAILRTAKQSDPLTQVIILTGYGDMFSVIEALRLEADDYLLKPCEMEEIQFKVDKCFEALEQSRKIKAYESSLPVCMSCKKVRDDQVDGPEQGTWISVEQYLFTRASVNASSTYCPEWFERAQKQLEEEIDSM